MGCDYKAYAVLGVKLSKHELFKDKAIRAFEHNYPDDWKVDPKTGRQLWTTYKVCILNDSEDLYGEIASGIRAASEGTDDNNYYLGLVAQASEYSRDNEQFIRDWNTDDLKNKLKALLDPHHLWFPERFGLYAVSYVSY